MASINPVQGHVSPRLGDRLHTLWQQITAHTAITRTATLTHASPLALPTPMSALLAQAVRENANHELDWLWYAAQMQTVAERDYCLARARFINPR